MPLINPVQIFKDRPDIFDSFLRALSTLHSTGVIEMLRERGQVRPTAENSPNYQAAQAAKANWSLGFNRAIDELIYFRDLFLSDNTTNTQPPPEFGSLERAVEVGDLTEEEANAIRNNDPIPILHREPIPPTVHVVKPEHFGPVNDPTGGAGGSS